MDNSETNYDQLYDLNLEKVYRFNKFEKIFFRIDIVIIGVAIFFLVLFDIALESLAGLVDVLMLIFLSGLVGSVVSFFISIIRILKYLFNIRKIQEASSIWRSILIIFLSPIAFILYYLLIFVVVLSSCGT